MDRWERQEKQREERRNKQVKFLRMVAILSLLGLVSVSGLMTSCTTIDAGEVGVVKHFGAVQPYVLNEGIHFVRPYGFARVVDVDTKMHAVEAEASSSSKDLQGVGTKVTVNFSVTDAMAPRMVQRFGTAGIIAQRVLAPAVQESVKSVTAKYTAEELITKRGEVKRGIEVALKEFVEQTLAAKEAQGTLAMANIAITDFHFSPEFDKAIEAKVKAEQDALKAENEKKKRVTNAEASAAEKKLEAEAEAFKIESESKARADAIERESKALKANPELIQLRIAEKWNGTLPKFTGQGGVPLLKFD